MIYQTCGFELQKNMFFCIRAHWDGFMVGLSIDQWIYRLAIEHSYGKQSFLAGFYRFLAS